MDVGLRRLSCIRVRHDWVLWNGVYHWQSYSPTVGQWHEAAANYYRFLTLKDKTGILAPTPSGGPITTSSSRQSRNMPGDSRAQTPASATSIVPNQLNMTTVRRNTRSVNWNTRPRWKRCLHRHTDLLMSGTMTFLMDLLVIVIAVKNLFLLVFPEDLSKSFPSSSKRTTTAVFSAVRAVSQHY